MAGWISGILSSSSLEAARQVAVFAEARNAVLADNIANIDTPNYKVRDLPVAEFQEMLGRAISESRRTGQPLQLQSTRNIEVVRKGGRIEFRSIERQEANILFHDGGNRSIEQEMSELAKNTLMHRTAIEVLRKQYGTLEAAIRGKL
ncbi:MAG: flagellar basal body rod protein FlgB [Anaerolineaceae bacterium]|nr:flagellar basal body rod protein FlgB [Anaerolineaceae bacterium]